MKKYVLVCLFLYAGISCQANVITVDDSAPADFDNIQAAVNASAAGDIIEVRPGTYKGTGNRDIDFLGKAITITSIDPNDPAIVASTIINCQGSAAEPHCGFLFQNHENSSSVISGLTITGGYNDYGGAISCQEYCGPIIEKCTLYGNTAAHDGGAIYCPRSASIIRDCTITYNTAGGYGGAIRCCLGGAPQITNCNISFNSSGDDGGAIEACGSAPAITDCNITANTSSLDGGAIFSSFDAVLTRCNISGNTANLGGALALEYGGHAQINNCTITNNSANKGGAIFCEMDTHPTIFESVIRSNTSPAGYQVWINDYYSQPSAMSVSYCNIEGGLDTFSVAPTCSLDWGPGNYDEEIGTTTTQTIENVALKKCTVKAGKNNRDTLTASGPFHPSYIMLAAGSAIHIDINSSSYDNNLIYSRDLPFSPSDIKKGKFTYKHRILNGQPGAITSFSFDLNKHTFTLQASKINLTGLNCPLNIKIDMGNYACVARADESIVNGRAFIPIQLMSGFRDDLQLHTLKITKSVKPSTDSVYIKGAIAFKDKPASMNDVVLTIVNQAMESQSFTIPAASFTPIGKTASLYVCRNKPIPGAASVYASFDFTKCSFLIKIRKTTIPFKSGQLDVNLSTGPFNQDAEFTLGN